MRNIRLMTWFAASTLASALPACGSGSTDHSGSAGNGGGAATGAAGESGASAGKGGSGSGGTTGSGATGGTSTGGGTGSAGQSSTGGDTSSGGDTATGGGTGTGGDTSTGGDTGTGGNQGSGGSTGGGTVRHIPTQCGGALPAGSSPVNTSTPTTVVGNGSAASCSFAATKAAIEKGGIVTFKCGSAPVTIGVTSTIKLRTDKDTVIDGRNLVTLDGQHSTQILSFIHGDFMANETRVTLQHLNVVNGKTTPTKAIPTAPAPCSQGYDDGEGGGLYMLDGNLTIIDSTFDGNEGAPLGPDTGGGGVYITGSKHGALIVGSVFTDNKAANGGGLGSLFATLQIYNSVFKNNEATGNGANSDDASKCGTINNNQHEVGSGGNGGAFYEDGGASTTVTMCGVDVEGNKAGNGAFGSGVFITSNDWSGTLKIIDSTVTGNTGGGSWSIAKDGSYPGNGLGTAFGVNEGHIEVTSSTLQGH